MYPAGEKGEVEKELKEKGRRNERCCKKERKEKLEGRGCGLDLIRSLFLLSHEEINFSFFLHYCGSNRDGKGRKERERKNER